MISYIIGLGSSVFIITIITLYLLKKNIIEINTERHIKPYVTHEPIETSHSIKKIHQLTLACCNAIHASNHNDILKSKKNVIDDIKELSQSNIFLYRSINHGLSAEAEDIETLYPEANNYLVNKIIYILIHTPILHNKECSIEDLSKTSNAIILLNHIKKININNFNRLFLSVTLNHSDEQVYGCLFIYRKNHRQQDINIDDLQRTNALILCELMIKDHLYDKLNKQIKFKNARSIIAARKIKEIKHDSDQSISIVNNLAKHLAKEENIAKRLCISKRISSNCTILHSSIDKIDWIFINDNIRATEVGTKISNNWINPTLWIKELFSAFETKALEKNLNYLLIIDNCIPDRLLTNEKALTQITFNFISNAIRYTERGTILVQFKHIDMKNSKSQKYKVSIYDSGRGINEKNHDKIFNQEFREHRDITGNGIGLSICKKAAAQINGDINFESKENVGSCFSITFNAEAEDIEDTSSFSIPKKLPDIYLDKINSFPELMNNNQYDTSESEDNILIAINEQIISDLFDYTTNKKIKLSKTIVSTPSRDTLIKNRYQDLDIIYIPNRTVKIAFIEDQTEMINHWKQSINLNNFSVDFYLDPESALTGIKNNSKALDLIITDFNLNNNITGIDLIKQLRTLDIITPTILLTAENAENINHTAHKSGIEKILPKSISPEMLIYEIMIILTKHNIDFFPYFTNKESNNRISSIENNKPNTKQTIIKNESNISFISKNINRFGDIKEPNSLINKKINDIVHYANISNHERLVSSVHNIKNFAIVLKIPIEAKLIQLNSKDIKFNDGKISDASYKYLIECLDEFIAYYEHIQEYIKERRPGK